MKTGMRLDDGMRDFLRYPLLGHRDVPSPHPHNLKIEITFLMTAIGNLYLQKTYSRTITRQNHKRMAVLMNDLRLMVKRKHSRQHGG